MEFSSVLGSSGALGIIIWIAIFLAGAAGVYLSVDAGISEAELVQLASANPKVVPHIAGKPIKRTIYVKGRLINLLV